MPGSSLAIRIVVGVVIFVMIAGGVGYFYKTERDWNETFTTKIKADREKKRQAELAKVKEDEEFQRRQADELIAAKAADAKRREQEAEEAAAEAKKKREAAEAAWAAERVRRIALLTRQEQMWLDEGNWLANKEITNDGMLAQPGALAFLLRNADLMPEVSIDKKIITFAETMGADKVIIMQEPLTEQEQRRVKLAFGIMRRDLMYVAEGIAEKWATGGVAALNDAHRTLMRNYPDVFPKVKLSPR